MKKYEVTVWNRKTGKMETLVVDFAEYKRIYWSYWYDIITTCEVTE